MTTKTLFNSSHRVQAEVIGIPVDIGNIKGISKKLMLLAGQKNNAGGYICVANVHMLTIAHESAVFKSALQNAKLVVPDGMPLVWTQKLKGFKQAERVSGPDLMLELCKLASLEGKSIYLLGSNAQTLSLLSQKLLGQFPNLQIAGIYAPEKLPEQALLDQSLVDKINSSGASFLFVGLGCPKQEYWCATHAPHLKAIALGVGAAFDFHAGTKKRPPKLIQQWGLEWLYRLLSEPGRLWRRYLVSNSEFVYLSLKDFLGFKQHN
ncbi:WecB/TagA/CpsF family glycosyltransferase [Polynucleobacter sp. MG-5-Ahmo-C2]|uniref:WecB/TagA/CpsF family glycosyltransferase n=1 Tax=Polynucleobacter sp. MG-5-Ahmo-C2 TaxID=2081051 RepID=UPI001BFDE552|nr:WecB/TagA/CpsF family glycosyltransferase [Polynucleobacter sp. MG-5-Ahmo-C2]QWD98806.1 WecB/TagA/CpsF family glycosyltransferase [Polynucleobacter sp. MG-5-Ahmo-C2]